MRVRPAAIAGTFYPADADGLDRLLDACLADAKPLPDALEFQHAIVPHAGLIYSGPVAATIYGALAQRAEHIRKVLLIGPAHRVAFRGLAVPTVDAFQTPLGPVKLAHRDINRWVCEGWVQADDGPHALEHALEIQLPFLQRVLGDFELLPVVVGHAHPSEVQPLIADLASDPSVLTLISSDLSHFNDYPTAVAMDRRTADAIEQQTPDRLDYHSACGRIGIQAMLQYADENGMQTRCVDLRNSGDTQGGRDRVVGYGAFVLGRGDQFPAVATQ